MIIGVCGIIGSGKNTVADYLIDHHGFIQESFARSLKDAVASVFSWDREMLEGLTDESRAWREQVDAWWAQRLGITHLTPRWVLQNWGTDVLRQYFHDDIWIASAEKRLTSATDDVVLSDLRFPNEFTALKKIGAVTARVKRGPDPEWFVAAGEMSQLPMISPDARTAYMKIMNSGIHESEWAWAGQQVDFVIENNGEKSELYDQVDAIINSLSSSHTRPS